MFTKGDKIILTKGLFGFKEGEIFEVTDVAPNGFVSFEKKMEHGQFASTVSINIVSEFFKKYEEPKPSPTVTQGQIDAIMEEAEIAVDTVFDKCTVVTCKLPNGFVIVESSACVSSENYDEAVGFEICYAKIVNKVWELEGYKLQDELYRKYNEVKSSECLCSECDHNDECWEDEDYYDEDDCDCENCEHADKCPSFLKA